MSELIKRDGEILEAISVQDAAQHCGSVREFIERQGLAVALNPKAPDQKYVMCEGWQAAGSALGCVACVRSIEKDAEGNVVAICDIERGGVRVGSGVGIVGVEETKFRRLSDRYGMAQTRAISRAYRNCLAWVVRDMGYAATPAEEYEGVHEAEAPEPPGVKKLDIDEELLALDTMSKKIEACKDMEALQGVGNEIAKRKDSEKWSPSLVNDLKSKWVERSQQLGAKPF